MHYGILSKSDEETELDRLGFILPAHEYFHQSMVVADCSSTLFRDNSRGLEGGVHYIATLLNRKEAKDGKGKNSFNALKEFTLFKADAEFCHLFIQKFSLDAEVDNTPHNLKKANKKQKQLYLHKMVEEARP